MAKPQIVVEKSPWQTFFESAPDMVLSFMQLQQQLETIRINQAYKANREDLKFAREEYLQIKKREDAWRDKLSTSGYSTEHITDSGETLKSDITTDIQSKKESSENAIGRLQSLNAELEQWTETGLEWQKEFGAFEDEERENEYRNLLLEGGLSLDDEGNVVGTGEFAEAIKGLSKKDLELLKDENYRTAIKKKLRTEEEAIKQWGTLMTGQKVASEIGQKRSSVVWQNIINTAGTYSGRETITALQNDLIKYDGYQDTAGNLTLEGQRLEAQKATIGREYEYLVMGNYTDIPENATEEQQLTFHRRWISNYNTMAADFEVAKPTAGGYGRQAAPGNQLRLRETIASAYNNFQDIVAGGNMDEASAFSSKALKYLGVNFNDPSIIEELDLQSTLDRNEVTEEILASLDYTERLNKGTLGPEYWDPEFNEENEELELGPPVPEKAPSSIVPPEDDPSYYQQTKGYIDTATEAVWGPEIAEAIKAIPMYKAGRAYLGGLTTTGRVGADILNQTLFDIGAAGLNIGAVSSNQLIKLMTGYSPGFSGERLMENIPVGGLSYFAGKQPKPRTDPDYSFGTYTPKGGFWTKEMASALGQLASSDKQLSKPEVVTDSLNVIDTLAAVSDTVVAPVDTISAIPPSASEAQKLSNIYMNSPFLKNKSGLSFREILDDFYGSGIESATDYIMDRFGDYIEEYLIR